MSPSTKTVLTAAAALLPAVSAFPTFSLFSKRQDPLLGALPGCATDIETQFQPAFDFDTDSCYNAPAVDPSGNINPGRDTCSIADPGNAVECRQQSYLDNNNVYVRSRTNNGWTALLYGYYFEVDHKETCGGHRHDWEHVVVWLEGSTIRYVAASAHGGYDVRSVDEIMMDGEHPKIVYHRDGSSTHAMRFAQEDDDTPVENHTGAWFFGDVIDYYGFPTADIRDAMINGDFAPGKIDFSDARIADALETAKGGNDIPLDTGVDEEGTIGNNPCA